MQGVAMVKVYFATELRSKYELVKVSEVWLAARRRTAWDGSTVYYSQFTIYNLLAVRLIIGGFRSVAGRVPLYCLGWVYSLPFTVYL